MEQIKIKIENLINSYRLEIDQIQKDLNFSYKDSRRDWHKGNLKEEQNSTMNIIYEKLYFIEELEKIIN